MKGSHTHMYGRHTTRGMKRPGLGNNARALASVFLLKLHLLRHVIMGTRQSRAGAPWLRIKKKNIHPYRFQIFCPEVMFHMIYTVVLTGVIILLFALSGSALGSHWSPIVIGHIIFS